MADITDRSDGLTTLLRNDVRKSDWPARLDLAQSLSGLALGIFMWTHLLLVSSILISEEAMASIAHFMELGFLTPGPGGYPIVVTFIALGVFVLFIGHAGLAMRKFPANWRQYKIMSDQAKMLPHAETKNWFIQAKTGFIMFFLGSVHIYIMATNPSIDPYTSADRVWSYFMWPLYLVLLFAVELHGAIGMYRLSVKWGVFDGDDPRQTRKRLKTVKTLITVFFLVLGVASLAAYMKIGFDHAERVGEPYQLQMD
jgi:fumarate reductase subunit C